MGSGRRAVRTGSISKPWGLSRPGWTPHCQREALGAQLLQRPAGWLAAPVCTEFPVPSHTHWASLPLPHVLVLEPLLLLIFPTFLFPRPTGLGRVILGKSLVIPGFLRGGSGGGCLLPKANQPGMPKEFIDSGGPRNLLKWSPK